jgi:hypothetical protein
MQKVASDLPATASAAACSYCRRPFEADEPRVVLMRDGVVSAEYHERCHPHYRRSGCSAC